MVLNHDRNVKGSNSNSLCTLLSKFFNINLIILFHMS